MARNTLKKTQPKHAPATRSRREERVQQILAAARDQFGTKGFDATTVAEIAAEVGVVEGLIYKYFPTKRALLLAVLGHWYDEMFGDYARELAYFSTCRKRVHYLVWRHLCTVRDYPRLCGLMFREVLSAEHDYRNSDLHEMNRQYTRLLVETLQKGMDSGEFRNDVPPQLLRSLVYGGIEHESYRYLASFIAPGFSRKTGHPPLDVDTLADQITLVLYDGLCQGTTSTVSETAA